MKGLFSPSTYLGNGLLWFKALYMKLRIATFLLLFPIKVYRKDSSFYNIFGILMSTKVETKVYLLPYLGGISFHQF